MRFHIDTADPRPVHVQIVDEVRRALILGTLHADDPLPPVRDLAAELRVNPGTVARAYRALESEGVVAVRWGEGPVVAPGEAGPEERRALARRVAQAALRDARRNGLSAEELIDALREAAGEPTSTPEPG
ncbi:MAG TPA: GntR family transcriptional regulator [Longimicrobium sp.]|jgi:GntR family transcriptional regulator